VVLNRSKRKRFDHGKRRLVGGSLDNEGKDRAGKRSEGERRKEGRKEGRREGRSRLNI
jgi:hypothetical protein